jgi:hypothetical protein
VLTDWPVFCVIIKLTTFKLSIHDAKCYGDFNANLTLKTFKLAWQRHGRRVMQRFKEAIVDYFKAISAYWCEDAD